ncbi:MAG: Dabb family protein [Actinobacteria bacterium]|jgi:hypothetical protein|nr:Dabb family protein [Actinomycetota bacterium]MCL6095992.1 Dabb family protein [Actinomycetota bacterium]
MIRSVAVFRLKDGVPAERISEILSALFSLEIEGAIVTGGEDLGLRGGNAHFAVVTDLVDEEAYRRYDEDPEHNRIRRELVNPVAESIERCQFFLNRSLND